MGKIDLLEEKSFTNQVRIRELKQEEQKLLQFSLRDDIEELKTQRACLNNEKYFLNDIFTQFKEINDLLNDEMVVVKDEFHRMVPLQ